MKKKSVKGIRLLLTLVLSVSILAGCQGKSQTPSQTSDSETTSEEERVTISYFSYQSEARDDIQKQIDLFEERNPNIKVEFNVSPTNDYPQLLKTKVASGDAPDVFTLWPGLSYVTYYAKNGHLMDLSNEPWVKNIVPGAMSTITYEDKIYAQPIKCGMVGVIYNKDIFAELNLEIPQTWEEFLDCCEAIKAAGHTPLSMPLKTDWPGQFLPIYALPCNIVYSVNPEFDKQLYEGEVTFSDSDYKKCFEMFMELNEKGYVNEAPLGISYEQSQSAFAAGDTVMAVNGDWYLAQLDAYEPSFEVGMFPVPAPEGYQTTIPVGGDLCNVISADTDHPEAAKKLLEFLATQEAYDLVSLYNSSISLLSNVETNVHEEIINNMIPASNTASYSFTNLEWVPGIQEAFQKGYQELYAGTKTIEEMLRDVDKVAETNIKAFKEGE